MEREWDLYQMFCIDPLWIKKVKIHMSVWVYVLEFSAKVTVCEQGIKCVRESERICNGWIVWKYARC